MLVFRKILRVLNEWSPTDVHRFTCGNVGDKTRMNSNREKIEKKNGPGADNREVELMVFNQINIEFLFQIPL